LLALFAALLLLSVGPGATASTSTPPRNGLIALNGPEGIYVVDPSTGTTKLIPKSAEMSDPAWSPDGTTLAVSAPYGESSAVFTMKPDGSERHLVLENAYSPSWSPDGNQLIVVRDGSTDGDSVNALAIVNSDGSDARTLELAVAENSQFFSAPEWSPDGKLIAFVAAAGDGATIELVSLDGKAASIPEVEVNGLNGLSFSPDSTSLAFDRYVETKSGGHLVAVVLDLATGQETVYAGEQLAAQAPTWSPEGDQIAFLSTSERSTSTTTTTTHSCGGEDMASQLWVMSPDGTKAHRLVDGEYYGTPSWARASEDAPAPAPVADEQPAPAPGAAEEPAPAADDLPASPNTSDTPAVTSEPAREPLAKNTDVPSTKGLIAVRGSNAIYLVNPDDAAAHKVPDTADMIAPAWSPDGSLLAVERVQEAGVSSIYTIRPDGTQPQLVLKNASTPSWSPAGDRIFVVRNECSTTCEPEDDEANVRYSIRPDGSDLQRVDLEQADLQDPRELAWRTDGSPIWFFDDGSANAPGSFDTAEAAWSPDESRIAFIGALGSTEDEASADSVTAGLWIVSTEGGTPQLLLKGASGWPSWPSDSR
jgi:Tol biopolymer transport system component